MGNAATTKKGDPTENGKNMTHKSYHIEKDLVHVIHQADGVFFDSTSSESPILLTGKY